VLAGAGGFFKTGGGSLTLAGSSSIFFGMTTVSGGVLDLASSTALQLSTVVVPASGFVFDKSVTGNAFVLGNISGSGNLALQNSSTAPGAISLTVGGNNTSSEYFGVLSGSGSLGVAGGGLTLANTSTFTGGITVAGGVLQFGDGTLGHDGLYTGPIQNNSSVVFAVAGSETYASAISGTGSVGISGSGLVTLTGTSSFTGGTMVSAGTLQLGDGTSGHDALLSGTGGIVNNSCLAANVASLQAIGTPISGTGSLVKTGSGLLTFTAPGFYTGGTLISAGTLQLGNGVSGFDGSLSGVGGVTDNSVLTFNIAGFQNYAAAITGSGSLVKLGSGSLTLTGTNNSYGGVTNVLAGLLTATNSGALPGYASLSRLTVGGSGTLALTAGTAGWTATAIGYLLASNSGGFASGSTLAVDTTNAGGSFSYGGTIPGNLGLTKLGPNGLILTGTNTYLGVTTISGGTLQLGNGTSGDDGVISGTGGINDGTALVYDLYGGQSYAGAITGPGSLTKLGTGSLTLQGSNTFSGITNLSSGTLVLANIAALKLSTLVASTTAALVFDKSVSGAYYIGAISGSGNLVLQNNAATPAGIALNAGGNGTYNLYYGALSGPGSLTKSGSGLLTLTGSNSFTGGTTISGGTLQLGNGLNGHDGSLASGGSVSNNAALSFDYFSPQTFSGAIAGSGSVLLASGSLTLAPGASLVSTSGYMHVGQTAGATLNVLGGALVNVAELDVNYHAAVSGYTGYLNLQGGTVNVSGPVTIGHSRMETSPADVNSLVNQSGGTLTAGGIMTIGLSGLARSIYNITGGAVVANDGLIVGAQGNGVLNISGSGNVLVSTTAGLSIGGDESGATGGTVSLSGGTLAVNGNTILGNAGIGALVRTGGVFSDSGSLIAAGAGTLVLSGSGGSVATSFSGHIANVGAGTLVVVPYNNLLGGYEALTFGQSSTLTNGILGAWAVRTTSGTNSSGDYLTLSYTNGAYSAATASYSGSLASSTSASVLSLAGSSNSVPGGDSYLAYSVKFGGGSITTINGQLAVGSGIILNGGTLAGGGVLRFAAPGSPWNYATGMVYAGSGTASVIATQIDTTSGMVKFGPGALILSGYNGSLRGGILVSSGVLNVQDGFALGLGGSGNDVLVASGAELDLQGNVALPAVDVGISGTGVGNAGGLHSLSGTNSMAGILNVTKNLQIGTDSGILTLVGSIQGSYGLTKTGTGVLALTADSSALYSGPISVLQGTLDVSSSGGLGTVVGVTTVSNGASLSVHGGVILPQSIVIAGSGAGASGALINSDSKSNGISGSIVLAGATQIAANAGALSLYGQVSGGYGLTKTGSGTLFLANAANNFSGPVTVLNGTLSVLSMSNSGSAGPLGLGTSAVILGASGGPATFDYGGAGDTSNRPFSIAGGGTGVFQVDNPGAVLTLSGPISGSGALIMSGLGQLTLGGSTTYSGSTTVDQGILAVAPGASLGHTSGITVVSGGLLQLTNSGSNQLSGSASITLQGSALNFVGNGVNGGGDIAGNLLLGAGENDISVSLAVSGTNKPYLKFASFPSSHTIGAGVVFSTSSAQVQFSNSASLTGGILGGFVTINGTDFATLSGGTLVAYSAYTTGDLGALLASSTMNAEPTGLQSSLSSATTINSLNLTGAAGVQMTSTGSLTLVSGGLIANSTGGVRGGTLQGSASGELTIYAAQSIAISSAIPDNGGPTALVISGPGIVALTGSTSYTGDTYLNNSSGGLVLIPPASETYAGAIHGLGNLTKSGTATLTFSGTSDYSGTTTITGGGLIVNGALTQSEVTLQSSALLGGSGTIVGDVTTTGGTIAMSQAGEIQGAVTISSGTLTVGSPAAGNYLNTLGGLSVSDGAALVVSPSAVIVGSVTLSTSANTSFLGALSGSGSFLIFDGGPGTTLTLGGSASSSYGGVVVDGGTLKIANSAALGGNALTVNGGTVDLGGTARVTVGSLSGYGAIESSSGASTLAVDPSSGSFEFDGSIINGSASGAVSLLKAGEGELVLAGSNTYSGGTVVTAGTLVIDAAYCLQNDSSLLVGSGASSIFGAAIPDATPSIGVAAVPEPAGWMLLLVALWSAVIYRRFRFVVFKSPHSRIGGHHAP
jgi:fibronectin-binding autotransporter adhesin